MTSKLKSIVTSLDYTSIAALLFFGVMAVLFTTPVPLNLSHRFTPAS